MWVSVSVLLVANLLPLFGVWVFGWDLFALLLAYWLESGVVGIYTVLKLVRVRQPSPPYILPFFMVHFSLFMLVHLIFLVQFIGPSRSVPWQWLAITAAGLMVSHGVSYVQNFVGRREYEAYTAQQLMLIPYPRIVVMHLTLFIGGLATLALGAPTLALLVLVAVKIMLDIRAHVNEHQPHSQGARLNGRRKGATIPRSV